MNNEKEIAAVELSASKKDFYQIWAELIETASKISERWNPESTNESDPGIVLLKVLTAIADKLNYSIDTNILEAFMPSASQEESMRKLCDMLGYSMKYYQSATTTATIAYIGDTDITSETHTVAKYSNLKNTDEDINYVTLEDAVFGGDILSNEVECIEGELVECTPNDDGIITIDLLDDNQRYYLPETQIAENGIFITNTNDGIESELWTKVNNLNTQVVGSHVYKFGYDSKQGIPYIQFPEDISTIIEDGIKIKFIRTNGINGNISAGTLNSISSFYGKDDEDEILESENFTVTNASAAMNGTNIETLDDAYTNYKKTIGTFDTLVTCRDYMNKIYQLMDSETNTTPLVSNAIVSDIRDDINRAFTLCSFNEYGICYTDNSKPVTNDSSDTISHFDLLLYPFKTVTGLNTKLEYKNSFRLNKLARLPILAGLDDYKTISHNIVLPDDTEIACIKNYLRLNAKITTTTKVSSIEESTILSNIYTAIYKNFNLRKLDFGEEIPFDTILDIIENADTRIKNVSLDEPVIYTKFLMADGTEYDQTEEYKSAWEETFNKLAIRNVLAGRVPLFNYDESFKPEYTEKKHPNEAYKDIFYPTNDTTKLVKMKSEFKLPIDESGLPRVLKDNETIHFRLQNFKTTVTYPAYVNYYIHIENGEVSPAIPATFESLLDYLQKPGKTYSFPDIVMKEGTKYTQESGGGYTYVGTSGNYDLKFESETFGTLYQWLLTQATSGEEPSVKISGLFKRSGPNMSWIPGYLIDDQYYKYTQIYSYSSEALTGYYVQIANGTSEEGKDGLGKDAEYRDITANEDYKLQANEYLAINYTNSTTDEDDNTTSSIINIVYKEGTIIRPNIDLIDSASYKASGKSYSKTSGFDFSNYSIKLDGLYALGTNEQIEIREPVQVELDDTLNYIYWERQDEDQFTDTNGYIKFDFSEDGGYAYTLKEGEYFYYTNSSKSDLAYYGYGTKIVRVAATPDIYKQKTDETLTADDIATYGLAAAIPWVAYDFSNGGLTLKEYQYITLSKDDTLESIKLSTADGQLTNNWVKVEEAKYILSGSEAVLPSILVDDIKWEARTRLGFNMGPVTTQTLYADNSIDLYNETDTKFKTLTGDNTYPVSIKSNYVCQANTDTVDVHIKKYDSEGTLLEELDDFKVKVFKKEDLKVISGKAKVGLNLNNFGNKWTKINFEQAESGSAAYTELNMLIPNNEDGLVMFYYLNNDDESGGALGTHPAYITALDESENDIKPTIFNYIVDDEESWWTDIQVTTTIPNAYYFREGINIVRIPKSCTLSIYPDSTRNSTLTFSGLDLIPDNNNLTDQINPRIDYYITTEGIGTAMEQILSDIRALDDAPYSAEIDKHQFYYNNIIDNSLAIDFNTNITDVADSNYEKLSTPTTWYDYNNINNKFVISEIDADYLSIGITLTRNSKK